MTDSAAQLLAGGLLIAVAAVAFLVGFRMGKRHGVREVTSLEEEVENPRRQETGRKLRPPRPPKPPPVVH